MSSRYERGESRLDIERTSIESMPTMPSDSFVACSFSRGGAGRKIGAAGTAAGSAGAPIDGGEAASPNAATAAGDGSASEKDMLTAPRPIGWGASAPGMLGRQLTSRGVQLLQSACDAQ